MNLGRTEKTSYVLINEPTLSFINLFRHSVKPDDFEFRTCIGKGSFGKVYLARHKGEDTIYAVKVVSKALIKRKREERHIMAERDVLVKNTRHPFLVSLQYSFQTPDKLYFVMDFVNGGEVCELFVCVVCRKRNLHLHILVVLSFATRTSFYRTTSEILCSGNHLSDRLSPQTRYYLSRFKTRKYSSRSRGNNSPKKVENRGKHLLLLGTHSSD